MVKTGVTELERRMTDTENIKNLKTEIPETPFDEVDEYDDWVYEDDLIDDLDVIIPPKVYLHDIIPTVKSSYVKGEWIKFVLNNMGGETYIGYVDDFIKSMKRQIQKVLWKKEIDTLPEETKKDSVTMNFRKRWVERESERLSDQMIDEFTKWYEDLNFKKSKSNSKIS